MGSFKFWHQIETVFSFSFYFLLGCDENLLEIEFIGVPNINYLLIKTILGDITFNSGVVQWVFG